MSQASRGGSSTQPPSNSTSPPSSTSSSLRGYVSDDWNRGVRQEERSREYASDDPTSKPSVGIIGSRIGGADTPGKKPFLSRNRRWQRGNSLVQKNNAFGSNLANWGLPSFSSNKHSRSQVLSPPLARNTQYGSGYRKESRSKYYQQRHRADQTPNNSKPRRAVRKKRNSEPNAWRATLGLDGKSHPPTMTKYASPEILHPKTGKPVDPLKYKTALCSHFAKHGSCEFGSKCIFAHGHDELFQRQLEIKRIKAMEEEKEKLEREILVTESTLQKAQEPFLEMIQGVINDNESPSDKNSSQAMSQARSPGIRGLSSDIWSPPPPGFDPKVNPSSGTASAKQSLDRRPPLAPNLSPSMSPSVAANMYEIPPLISGSLGSDSLSSARDVIPDSEVSTQKFLLRKVKSAPKSSLSWPGPPKVASEDRIRDKNYNSQDKINMQQTPQSDTSSDGTALSAKTSPPGSEERVIVLENEVKQLRKALFLQQKQREAESRKKAEWERDKRAYTKKQPEFLKRKANSVLKKKVSDPTLAKAKSDGYKLVGVQWWKFLLGFIAILVFLNLAYFFMQSQSQKPGEGSPDQERDGLATVTHRKNDIVWVLTNDRGWRLAKVSKSVSDDREYRSARKHQRKDSVLMVHLLSRDHGIAKSSSYHDDYQVENGENVDSKAPSALAFRVEDQIKRVHPALLADRSSFKSFQQIIPILAKHNFPKLDVSLAEEVCLSLGDLARSPLHRAAIHGTAGVLSAVVGVLNSFSEIQSLQEACILALGNLAQAESATIKGLKESGAKVAIVAAMERHFSSDKVLSSSCVAIGNIAAAEQVFPAYAETKFKISASILDNIIQGMRHHAISPEVQRRCSFAIGAICRSSASLQRHATRFLGVPTLISAMTDHKADSGVLWRAAFAMNNVLSLNPSAREMFGPRGVSALLSSMNKYPKDARLQQWCCGALYFLIKDSKENLAACTAENGVEIVVRAMKLDESNKALVARADELLNILWEF